MQQPHKAPRRLADPHRGRLQPPARRHYLRHGKAAALQRQQPSWAAHATPRYIIHRLHALTETGESPLALKANALSAPGAQLPDSGIGIHRAKEREHEGTPRRSGQAPSWNLIYHGLFLAFLVPIIIIALMQVNIVASYGRSGAAPTPDAASHRQTHRPVAGSRPGRRRRQGFKHRRTSFRDSVCTSCPTRGRGRRPKVGDNAVWAPRIKEGLQAISLTSPCTARRDAAQGGGNPSLSTSDEVERAVVACWPSKSTAETSRNLDKARLRNRPAEPGAGAAAAAAQGRPCGTERRLRTKASAGSGAPPYRARPAAAVNPAGEKLYRDHAPASACHGTGRCRRPKFGSKADLGQVHPDRRRRDGQDVAIYTGKGAMPPTGGTAANAPRNHTSGPPWNICSRPPSNLRPPGLGQIPAPGAIAWVGASFMVEGRGKARRRGARCPGPAGLPIKITITMGALARCRRRHAGSGGNRTGDVSIAEMRTTQCG